jgi:hypothetical protein
VSNQTSSVAASVPASGAASASAGSSFTDVLAPDLLALFFGARPHPDVVIPQPLVTVAGLAAAARAAIPGADAQVALRWDGPGQRLTG